MAALICFLILVTIAGVLSLMFNYGAHHKKPPKK